MIDNSTPQGDQLLSDVLHVGETTWQEIVEGIQPPHLEEGEGEEEVSEVEVGEADKTLTLEAEVGLFTTLNQVNRQ